jgi:PAS domain S-box-containing protein
MVIVDSAGKIILVNVQTERLFGYDRKDLLEQPIELLIPTRFHASHQHHIQSFSQQPLFRSLDSGLELVGIRSGGEEFPVDISLSPIYTEQDMVIASVIRDITPQKAAEMALISARDELELRVQERTVELESRNEELDAFAQTVAHDLKNPLAMVTGMAEMLVKYRESLSVEELENYLELIARDGRKMDSIINELMVLSSVRQIQPRLEMVNVYEIATRAAFQLEYLIKQHNAQVSFSPAAQWGEVFGYAPWIETVWINYLSNAIKYGGTPPQIELGADPPENDLIRFWVRDNGQGLSEEEQSKLFVAFTRLSDLRVGGYGIGLSIVRRIIEKLGGQVGVESTPGQGSLFYFTLPLTMPH